MHELNPLFFNRAVTVCPLLSPATGGSSLISIINIINTDNIIIITSWQRLVSREQ